MVSQFFGCKHYEISNPDMIRALRQNNYQPKFPRTNWQTYQPMTIGQAVYRRVGDSIEIQVRHG